jgi:serine/threonine protein kinase
LSFAECIDREITSGKYSTRHNDIWALGVILTNLITGRNPWRYATADDDCFSAYLHDNNFLLQVLPISECVNTILKRIFRINPLRRITLPQLRQGILELTAFFMDEAPAITRETGVSRTARAITQLPTQARHQESTSSKDTLISSGGSSTDSLASEEHYIFASPVDDHPLLMSSPLPRISESGISTTHFGNFVIGESCDSLCPPSSSGSSRPESKGPITPVTCPADPSIDVPDIPDQDGLGQPIELSGISVINKISAISLGMKEKKIPGHIFRSALQRIKGLSAT